MIVHMKGWRHHYLGTISYLRLGCSDCDGVVQIGRLWTFQHHFCLLRQLLKDHGVFLVKHFNTSLGRRMPLVLVASAVVVFVVAVVVVVVVVVILCLQLDAEVVCHNTHQGVDPNHPEKLKNEEFEIRTKSLKVPCLHFHSHFTCFRTQSASFGRFQAFGREKRRPQDW